MSSFSSSRESNGLITIVKAQVVFLLSTLTEDRYERNQAEIRSLCEQHGVETYLHFIRRLIAASASRLQSSTTSTSQQYDTSSALTFRLLVQETQRLARDPFLADRFRDALDRGEGDIFRHFDLARFVERVGLKPLERLILASSIVSSSTSRRELAAQGALMVKVNHEDAARALAARPSFDPASGSAVAPITPGASDDLTPQQLARLLSHLLSDPPPDSPILDAAQRVKLISAAQVKYGQETVGPILQGIFPTLSLSPGTSLVQTLCQLGPELTSDSDTVLALLQRFGLSESSPPRENQVVEILSTLSRYAAEGTSLCDVGSLIKAICSLPGPIDWCNVLLYAFDRPERSGIDTATLKLLIAILPNTPRDSSTPTVCAFWEDWKNTLYQLRLLDALLSLPNDTFNLVSLPGRRIVTVDDVTGASPTIKALAANVQGHTWNSLDLIETLVRLGDSDSAEVAQCVRDMLDKAVKISAELVHMGLLQVAKPWGPTQQEYSSKLLGMFLAGHPNHQLVFMRIWQIDPTYLTSAFRDFYAESPVNITRILDVAQDLKILDSLLDVRPFAFALDVAALASRREYLNLDKWLSDHAAAHGEAFTHAVLEFLDVKINSELARQDPAVKHQTMPLNPQTISIFIRMLRGYNMSPSDAKYFTEIRNLSYQLHPRLMNLTPGSDAEPGLSVVTFSPEIETEVETIYRRMYDGDISIDQVIDMLRESKSSANSREKEIFACTLHSLFDEYKFFQSSYPARELAMTGYLFGSIIQYHLIDFIPLGIALRYVLDAIRSPPDSNLFTFGIEALIRFESRLPEWPPLCNTILRVPHLQLARPAIAERIRHALAIAENGSGEGSTSAGDSGIHLPEIEPVPLAFTAIQADDISEGPVLEPKPEDSEKILFIINNLAANNIESKLVEMKERFTTEYSRWFANYLVDRRASTEPNNHGIYLRFLDGINDTKVDVHVLNETYFKASILLNSESKPSQASLERTTMKNIASWLGSITLGRDKPIKYKNLAFKELLIEGYDNNQLLKAIPFVCKILEQSSKSTVFLPPNPWLMGVLGLLTELYHYADLRLTLKFEIEVLCSALGVDLEKIEPTTILRDRASANDQGPPLPDFVPDIDSMPISNYGGQNASETQTQSSGPLLPISATSPTQSQRLIASQIEAIMTDIPNRVTINPQLAAIAVNPGFKRSIQLAIERSVREIILPVVERSVTIAGISTRELVSKDFAREADEEKMRKAAHLMVSYLAGNLALVTCKEPLRSNMTSHIRHLLTEQGYNEQVVPEQVVALVVSDNIDMACAAIEKAAMERAVADVDDAFATAYSDRRLHRERPGHPFWDASIPHDIASGLPEPLRPQSRGIPLAQLRVYEDFALHTRSSFHRSEQPSMVYPSPMSVGSNPSLGIHQAIDRFTQIINDIERQLEQLPPSQTGATLPSNHDVSLLLRQILVMLNQTTEKDETALAFSQKVVQMLYKAPTQLGREVYAILLDRLCEASVQVNKEAIDWLLYAEDERKFNVPVTALLLKSKLLPNTDQDAQLAKLVTRDMKPSAINFTAALIRDAVLGNAAYAHPSSFRLSLEALTHVTQLRKGTELSARLLEDLRGPRNGPSDAPDAIMYDKLARHYADWVRLYQRSPNLEKAFVSWVTQLTAQGILKGEEISSFFYRVCVEASVTLYQELTSQGEIVNSYQPVDALSRLIVLMIKYNGDAIQTKVHYLTKILSIVVVVLAHFHEESPTALPQKPFFRLFSSLFNDLHAIESTIQGAYFQLLIALCDTFNTLQPTYFPGFAFSWISLISHRRFMPKLLMTENRVGWSAFHRLLLSLFKFLAPFIRRLELQNATRSLFRGAQRLLLVLLHDFPDFLAEYYFSICDAIPPRSIQLRNVVLSAYPPKLILPDPHLVDIQTDMSPVPTILSDFMAPLGDGELRASLDRYLVGRGAATFPNMLKEQLLIPGVPSDSSSERYSLSFMNSLVLYVGATTVAQAKARTGSTVFNPSDPGVSLLIQLASDLDLEGQHHLMTAIVMHLRFPSAHTQWYANLALHLFLEVKTGNFQEIATKVLLERFIVHRPHPWGALVTFIELLRNPKYEFWSLNFVRVVPEISTLLESVSRSISRGM